MKLQTHWIDWHYLEEDGLWHFVEAESQLLASFHTFLSQDDQASAPFERGGLSSIRPWIHHRRHQDLRLLHL